MAQALTLNRPLDGIRQRTARVADSARRLWRAYPRETIGVGLLGMIGAAAIAGSAYQPATNQSAVAPPAPPPLVLRQIAPERRSRSTRKSH